MGPAGRPTSDTCICQLLHVSEDGTLFMPDSSTERILYIYVPYASSISPVTALPNAHPFPHPNMHNTLLIPLAHSLIFPKPKPLPELLYLNLCDASVLLVHTIPHYATPLALTCA